jgi:hypothetical protein
LSGRYFDYSGGKSVKTNDYSGGTSQTGHAESERMKVSTRYPYTFAADYLRMKVGNDYGNGLISRSAASQVRGLIAKAIGLDDAYIAQKLADLFIKDELGVSSPQGEAK